MEFVILIKPGFTYLENEIIFKLKELRGFRVINRKVVKFTKNNAQDFYKIHSNRSFFNELIDYMISGQILALEVEGDIQQTRNLIGSTNPKDARNGTIRALFGVNVQHNVIHCSDSQESANYELSVIRSL